MRLKEEELIVEGISTYRFSVPFLRVKSIRVKRSRVEQIRLDDLRDQALRVTK